MQIDVKTPKGRVTVDGLARSTSVGSARDKALAMAGPLPSAMSGRWRLAYKGNLLEDSRVLASYKIPDGATLLLESVSSRPSPLVIDLQLSGDLDDDLRDTIGKAGTIEFSPNMSYPPAGQRSLLYEPGVEATTVALKQIAPNEKAAAALLEPPTWRRLLQRMRRVGTPRNMDSPSAVQLILSTFLPVGGRLRINNKMYVIDQRLAATLNGRTVPLLPALEPLSMAPEYKTTVALVLMKEGESRNWLSLLRMRCGERLRQIKSDYERVFIDPHSSAEEDARIRATQERANAILAARRGRRARLSTPDRRLGVVAQARERGQAATRRRANERAAALRARGRTSNRSATRSSAKKKALAALAARPNGSLTRGAAAAAAAKRRVGTAPTKGGAYVRVSRRRQSRRKPSRKGRGMRRKSMRRRLRA